MWVRQQVAWSDQAAGSCSLYCQEGTSLEGSHLEEVHPSWRYPHLQKSLSGRVFTCRNLYLEARCSELSPFPCLSIIVCLDTLV